MTDATPKAKRVQTPAQKAAFEAMRASRKAKALVVEADPKKKPKPADPAAPAPAPKKPDDDGWLL